MLEYSNEVLKDGKEVDVGEVVQNNFTLSGATLESRGCLSFAIVSTSFASVRRSDDMDKSSIKRIIIIIFFYYLLLLLLLMLL